MIAHGFLLFVAVFTIGHSFAQGFEEQRQFRYYENSRIEYDSVNYNSFSIVGGSYTVFEFTSDNAGDPGNHSRAESKIVFQIEKGADKFQLADGDIAAHNGIYTQLCRCQDRGVQPIRKGYIRGERSTSGTWDVEIDVTFPGRLTGKDYHIAVTGDYINIEK